MKAHKNFPSKPSTMVLAIAASCIAASAFAAPLAKRADYADKIYTEYADSADDKMSFDLNVVAQGKLKDLTGKKFSEIIGTPQRKLTASDDGFVTASHAFQNIQPNSAELADLNRTVADFEAAGYPVADGKYRILDVVTTMGRDVSSHKAIEFCWKKQFHCVLLDPSIEFIDSIANNRIRLMAEGAGPKVTTVASGAVEGVASLAGVCGLASNHAVKQKTVTYAARNIKYRNLLNAVLVNKDLGGQQSGVSCDTSCKPKPYGYSNVSSAQGYLGWRTACANNSGLGITGTTAKYIGKTLCTHKYALAASASITALNYGTAAVDLKIDVGGSVDATGGHVYESCGYF
jgi:hypothetical protein